MDSRRQEVDTSMESKQSAEDPLPSSASNSDGTNYRTPPVSTQLPGEKVFAMAGGAGKHSYSKNSAWQAFMHARVLPDLDRALDQVVLPAHGPVVVVDLGCSPGPNAVASVEHVIQKLNALRDPASPPVEFQVFFNDLPSNDFNNLFQLLTDGTASKNNFFAAGVPGSFYGRLFVRSSVHVFYSGLGVHFLSKTPDAVLDKNSPAFNKGRTWTQGATLATEAAYKEQAASDLKCFLDARATELVPGGLLLLYAMGRSCPNPVRPVEDDPVLEAAWNAMEEAWNYLVSEGIITEEQRDSFNVPWYSRTVEDVLAVVERCSSDFHLQTAKLCTADATYDRIFSEPEPFQLMKKVEGMPRGVAGPLLEAHLGKEVSEIYWQRYEQEVEKHVLPQILLKPVSKFGLLVVALRRK